MNNTIGLTLIGLMLIGLLYYIQRWLEKKKKKIRR